MLFSHLRRKHAGWPIGCCNQLHIEEGELPSKLRDEDSQWLVGQDPDSRSLHARLVTQAK
jgi:hypothetical protein